MSTSELRATVTSLRRCLEPAFAPDTAARGYIGSTQSAGHCAVVAWILHEVLGGKLVSAKVEGQSHWFNRLEAGGNVLDVDLTGDQFYRPPVQVALEGSLYSGTRERMESEVNEETRARARVLRDRAALPTK